MSKTYTDLQNNFPDTIDTIDKMQDLNSNTKTLADQYYAMVNANNIASKSIVTSVIALTPQACIFYLISCP